MLLNYFGIEKYVYMCYNFISFWNINLEVRNDTRRSKRSFEYDPDE